MKYKITVTKAVELDQYEKGCVPETYRDFGAIESNTFNSTEDALKYITYHYGAPYIFDDRLEYQSTENLAGFAASPTEIEQWKNQKCELFSATYSFYLERIGKVNHEELISEFPNIENAG